MTFRNLPRSLPQLALWAIATSLSACSGGPDPEAPPVGSAGGDASGDLVIRFYSGGSLHAAGPAGFSYGGDERRGPTLADALARSVGAGGRGLSLPKGTHPTSKVLTDSLPSVPAAGEFSAYQLLQGAAQECLVESGIPDPSGVVVAQPWQCVGEQCAYFMFDTGAAFVSHAPACDSLLVMRQATLCVAAKLKDVADAVAPVTWAHASLPGLPSPWTFPVQAGATKFIVRDAAMYSIASLALMDLARVAAPTGLTGDFGAADVTCSEMWTHVAKGDAGWDPLVAFSPTYQEPHYPLPLVTTGTPPAADDPATARNRLVLLTYVLRSGARLLRDLVDESVQADLAWAEAQRAHATDARRGTDIAWGRRGDSLEQWNSLAHAVRVVAGRWEGLGGPQDDRRCGGVKAMDLLRDAYGDDADARVKKREVGTAEQEAAVALVEAAGVVVPPEAMEDATFPATRDAVKSAVIGRAMQRLGLNPDGSNGEYAAFVATGAGQPLAAAVDAISDQDLRFALQDAHSTFRMVTSQGNAPNLTIPHPALGIGPSNTVFQGTVTSVGGIVLDRPIPRSDMAGDVIARAGGILEASTCNETLGLAAGTREGAYDTVFRDTFGVAQALEGRLHYIREQWGFLANVPATEEDGGGLAAMATAEVHAWAGPGQLQVTSYGTELESTEWVPTYIDVVGTGFTPADWGVPSATGADLARMGDQLVLVYGEPWVADCAARVRSSCPADFEATYVAKPTLVSVEPQSDWNKRVTNADGPIVSLRFSSGSVPGFNPKYHPSPAQGVAASVPNQHLYAVLRGDPASPGSRGKVLASLVLRSTYWPWGGDSLGTLAMTKTPVSTHQRDLLESILGLSKSRATDSRKKGREGTTRPGAYCITDGKNIKVPFEIFVPLENELNSDGDGFESSWKGYLANAKAAATRTDELGRQMIEQGLQKDLRREAAQAELGSICGDYAALDSIAAKDSQVVQANADGSTGQNANGKSLSPSDQATSDCLSEKRWDIVFLTGDPVPAPQNQSPTTATQYIRDNILHCPPANSTDPAKGSDLCNKPIIEYQFLGLAAPTPPPAAGDCGSVASAVPGLAKAAGFDGARLAKETLKDYMRRDALKSYLSSLRMVVDQDDKWTVSQGASVLFDSKAGPHWPGCRRPGGTCSELKRAWAMDRAFRQIDANTNEQQVPAMTDGEASEIRWRMQGAIWTIGAAAGGLPKQVFHVPVPARDWSVEPSVPAPLLAVFGKRGFVPSGDHYVLDGAPSDDLKVGGDGHYINAWTLAGPHEIPPQLAEVYGTPARFKHFLAMSESVTAHTAVSNAEARLGKIATGLDGVRCQVGDTPEFGLGVEPVQGKDAETARVDLAKLRDNIGSELCKRPPNNILGLLRQPDGRTFVSLADTFYGINEEGDGVQMSQVIPGETQANWGKFLDPAPVEILTESGMTTGAQLYGWDDVAKNGDCRPIPVDDAWSFPAVSKACVDADVGFPGGGARFTGRLLAPGYCTPAMRVPAFVNSYAPRTACGAAANLGQALVLACEINSGGGAAPNLAQPPSLEGASEDALPYFLAWMDEVSRQAATQASMLYLERVPSRIVDDFKNKKVGSGSNKGKHGELALAIRGALETLLDAWSQISGAVRRMAIAIDSARLQIAGANLQHETSVVQLEMQRIQINASVAHAALAAVQGCSGVIGSLVNAPGCALAIAGSEVQIGAANKSLGKLDALGDLGDKVDKNQINMALNALQGAAETEFRNVEQALTHLRENTATVASKLAAFDAMEAQARYEAAKGSGADFYVDPVSNKVVTFPVNTVMNRQYDVLKRRYEAALWDARYLAYLARRSIEQRIGIRLSSIKQNVGPFDPPAQWADDVCHMQGINYEKLRCFDVPVGGAGGAAGAGGAGGAGTGGSAGSGGGQGCDLGKDAIKNFADQYIGDYVAKLESFVTYYNVDYPSHEGDDIAVLSLKDDLVGPPKACMADGPNLLLYSGHLDASDAITGSDKKLALRGWLTNPCQPGQMQGSTPLGPSKCLQVRSAQTLAAMPPSPDGSGRDLATWLHDAPASELPAPVVNTGGAGGGGGTGGGGTGGAGGSASTGTPPLSAPLPKVPATSVGQVVHLAAGSYLLSWWDRAVDASGEQMTDGPTNPYDVTVLGPDLTPVASVQPIAHHGAGWSQRRVLPVTITSDQDVVVAFRASASGVPGNVVIGAVQLEVVTTGDDPVAYVDTGSSRQVLSIECKDRPSADLQKAFIHACDKDGCFYELATPVAIDTIPLSKGAGGKLAAGNYNYRHVSLALNMVGTGVLDCGKTGQQSCYASGFVEYSMFHDTYGAKIANAVGEAETFTFGTASINHAKGLTAEKYITNPLSSSDKALLDQASIQKGEYRGRPLDGQYRIRIWDSPQLRWDKLQDIQLVLTYRYWAPIQK